MLSRIATFTAVVGVVAVTAACERNDTAGSPVKTTTPAGESTAPPAAAVKERDNALVRAVNASATRPSVDVFADDARVFDDVKFKTVTPYREIPGERVSIAVQPADAPGAEPLARNSEGLDDGAHYTIFTVPGDDATTSLLVAKDDHSLPAAGKARLRVVHAVGGGGEIDVFAPGQRDPLFDGVNPKTIAGYREIDPVAGTLTVRPEGKAAPLVTLRDVGIVAGKSYTMVVVGTSAGTAKADAFIFEDAAEPATRQTGQP
jgi:Domain of unknown function (DUF4397)